MSSSSPSLLNTDRNLLFGVLALQMGCISHDALVAAMNAWVLDKGKPLAEVLLDMGALTPADRDLLEVVVKRHIELHHHDPAHSLAVLSSLEYVADELHQ